jgi:hypothetical protein
MVRFASGEPARWQNATRKGQAIAELEPGHAFGYGVDAGTGCFADASALPNLDLVDAIEHANGNSEGWLLGASRAQYDANEWASVILDPKTNANVVLFHSGFGDGRYPSFWGLSKADRPLCLVTDFGVYPRPRVDDRAVKRAGVGSGAHGPRRSAGRPSTAAAGALPAKVARIRVQMPELVVAVAV